ncbi:C2 domain-containing protein 5 isoform X1 [Eupeodes corollae]|uniref:C2 domain-containing protein 5 isoform X1 n=1 Tax=Eupeodes corollae TaxID=290404 RepID=UPI00248FABD4|nr:C2 domain-containing protein 5 isoform X1 [Eupeodes corollae]XP_055923456.1 C2 domain-containing protein 5 isoform X1 [Eupeodes corollae]
MPGKVGVKIKAGRNLPIMDRSSETTDAYVEIKLGGVTHKTDVCRKSLNPQWNTDWFRFEIDDAELQDEPLQIRLMDHDTYSANDAIGKVNISLNPLCLETASQSTQGKGAVLSGWIPVFDTMHGIRGEVNIIVKVDLFSDVNKFRQSSCGIQFFHSSCVPHGYRAQIIHGFVEELVVNDDPEYQWIDKIRTPRASNEARQVVFLRLSGQVQRKIGLKAINLGANAVIGYNQCFDLEGDVGVVARGIGTAVTLIKIPEHNPQTLADSTLIEEQTLNYLEFLTGSNDPCNDYFTIVESDRNLLIDQQKKPQLRSPSDDENFTENSNMRSLLRQEERRGEKPRTKLTHHVKRIKNKSRMIIHKKCGAFKKKLSDTEKSDNETKSLSSSYSTLSIIDPIRCSLLDLRNAIGLSKSPQHQMQRSISDATVSSVEKPVLNLHSIIHDSIRSSPDIVTRPERLDIREASQSSDSTTSTEIMRNFPKPCEDADAIPIITEESGASSAGELNPSRGGKDSRDGKESRDGKFNAIVDDEDLRRILKSLAMNEPNEDDIDLKSSSSDDDDDAAEDEDDERSADDEADEINWMQPGTTVDELECVMDERRGSLLHDLKDNIATKYQQLQECMQRSNKSPEKKKAKETKKTPESDDEKTSNQKAEINIVVVTADPYIPTTVIDLCSKGDPSEDIPPTMTSAALDKNTPMKDEFRSLDVPALTLTNLKPKQNRNKKNDFYSSQPEISEAANNSLCALPLDSSFVSLANFSPCRQKSPVPSPPPSASASPKKLPNSAIASLAKNCVTFTSPILQICPSTPTPTESDSSQMSPAEHYSPHNLFPHPKRTITANNNNLSDRYDSDEWSLSNKSLNHSQSLVTLSNHTNSSSLLAPSTPLSIKHNRSSTEVVSSSTVAGAGAGADAGASTSASASAGAGAVIGGGSSAPSAGIAVVDKRASPICRTMTNSGGHIRNDSTSSKMSPSPSKTVGISNATTTAHGSVTSGKDIEICRRSSDSDLSVTPKGNSICVPSERLIAATASMRLSAGVNLKSNPENMDMLEYPFLTLTKYPTGFILHLGATVAARSVKLLERVPNPDEPETRDSWWTELRMEIRSHARALGCNVVLGYSEATTISDDVCVLSATGTAAVINMLYNRTASQVELTGVKPPPMSTSLEERDILKEVKHLVDPSSASKDIISTSYGVTPKNSLLSQLTSPKLACTMCHVPYSLSSVPFNVKMKRCAVCRKGRVPDVLMATVEIPDSLLVTGRGCFMQAQVVRPKKDLRSESNAKEISDGLPFLEYELHRVLINKLKAKGMNAIFGLKAQVSIGERMIALIATGTAIFLKALPPPSVPKIVAGNSWTDKAKLNELQKNLQETYERNREIYQLKSMDPDYEPSGRCQSDTDESDDEVLDMDLNIGNKDACVLEVDDIEDLEIISLLMEPSPPSGFHVVNTQTVPGLHDMEIVRNLQFFTQVWRAKLGHNQGVNGLANHFQRLCQTIFFKLRSMMPCAICDLRFLLDLPESDEIQLLVTGMALGLGEVNKFKNRRKTINNDGAVNMNGTVKKSHDEELIFPLDEDQEITASVSTPPVPSSLYGNHSLKYRKGSPSAIKMCASRSMKHYPIRERFGIDITPLTYVPGGKIEKYLGNLNFFFIRESTSVREIGGISGFVHSFITELLAVVRAHITTLGGNAMVAFYMTELILVDNQHKNQAQCLVSIGGDVVYVSYHTDD